MIINSHQMKINSILVESNKDIQIDRSLHHIVHLKSEDDTKSTYSQMKRTC